MLLQRPVPTPTTPTRATLCTVPPRSDIVAPLQTVVAVAAAEQQQQQPITLAQPPAAVTAPVVATEPPPGVVAVDQLGPQSMTVTAAGAVDSCPNVHIGAVLPADLEGITFRGPIDIHAIEDLESVPMLVAAPVAAAPSSTLNVAVTDRIGQGAIWNAFATTATVAGLSAVLKVSCVSAYACEADGNAEMDEVRKHIVKDLLAHRALRDVPCVPSLLSVWAGVDAEGREYWATMEENAGREVEVGDMTDEQKQAVLDAYAAIHEHGVMHCDAKSIHWRFGGRDGESVRLIDFSHAVDLTALGAEHSRVMCLSEMGDVRDELEAHSKGWTREPYSLVPSPESSPDPAAP